MSRRDPRDPRVLGPVVLPDGFVPPSAAIGPTADPYRDRTRVEAARVGEEPVTDIAIGSKWHERRPRDMDHSGRLYEVISIEGDRVTLDQPKSFTDAGYRLGAQRRTTMQIARLVRDFKDVTHV